MAYLAYKTSPSDNVMGFSTRSLTNLAGSLSENDGYLLKCDGWFKINELAKSQYGGVRNRPQNQPSILAGGIPTPLKKMKVSWDDDIPNWMEKINMFQTTNECISHYLWGFPMFSQGNPHHAGGTQGNPHLGVRGGSAFGDVSMAAAAVTLRPDVPKKGRGIYPMVFLMGKYTWNHSIQFFKVGIYCWLVVQFAHLEKWWTSSVGMMIIPKWMESHKIPWFQSPPIRLGK